MMNTNYSRKIFITTCIDAFDIKDVEDLVRTMDKGHGTDEIMMGLSKLYDIFLPTENTMRRLSLMHQQLCNTGNLHEFCVTCVYIAAMESLITKLPNKMHKIKSEVITIEYPKIKRTLSCWF
tara:strand:- start:89 stop:454 length:366 start_codon:yes stop_codon:yes gene_type:complete